LGDLHREQKEQAKPFDKLMKGERNAVQVQFGSVVQPIGTTAEQEGFDNIAKVFRAIAGTSSVSGSFRSRSRRRHVQSR
jgi:hypothetical protein